MKFPQTPDDIKQEIYLSVDKYANATSQRYRQLMKMLQVVYEILITEGLIAVFADKPREKNLIKSRRLQETYFMN
jgi:hypothetical protein